VNKLKEIRLSKFLTQKELADLTGLTEASISRLERGIHRPRLSTIKKLAKALEIEPREFGFLSLNRE